MTKKHIFISSVQSEFAEERKCLAEYIRQDALFSRCFESSLFESYGLRTHEFIQDDDFLIILWRPQKDDVDEETGNVTKFDEKVTKFGGKVTELEGKSNRVR